MCHAHGLSPPALRSNTPYQSLTLPWCTNCPPSSAPLQLTSPMAILDGLTARQLLDSSTDLDSYSTLRRMESASTSLDRLDRNSTGSTGTSGLTATVGGNFAHDQVSLIQKGIKRRRNCLGSPRVNLGACPRAGAPRHRTTERERRDKRHKRHKETCQVKSSQDSSQDSSQVMS